MKLLVGLLRLFFRLLYHPFAWAYDWVAAAVSFGQWKNWIRLVIPLLPASGKLLELGHGPGHLQLSLRQQGRESFALDESFQMSKQAARRLKKGGYEPRLVRAHAQQIPFAASEFSAVVATFPTEYIFIPQTLAEVRRVLQPQGQLLVLFAAWVIGKRPHERLVAWLYRITGQAQPTDQATDRMVSSLQQYGFSAEPVWLEHGNVRLLAVVANKNL